LPPAWVVFFYLLADGNTQSLTCRLGLDVLKLSRSHALHDRLTVRVLDAIEERLSVNGAVVKQRGLLRLLLLLSARRARARLDRDYVVLFGAQVGDLGRVVLLKYHAI
jgi:hypothetical protein